MAYYKLLVLLADVKRNQNIYGRVNAYAEKLRMRQPQDYIPGMLKAAAAVKAAFGMECIPAQNILHLTLRSVDALIHEIDNILAMAGAASNSNLLALKSGLMNWAIDQTPRFLLIE